MKRNFKLAALSVAAAAALLSGSAAALSGGREAPAPPAPAVTAPAENLANEKKTYMLREAGGFLAVYVDGQLAMKTDIPAALLRGVDRQALQKGIRLDSYEEVLKRIEDFGS